MRKSPTKYSEEFKLSVIRDYYSSGMSKQACARKYQLCNAQLFRSWLKKYGNNSVPLQPEPDEDEMANRSKDSFSRLETLARDMMIDKAEEYFDVPIRKKSGAKQP